MVQAGPPHPVTHGLLLDARARGTHVARAGLPELSRSAQGLGLELGLGAALELPGLAGSWISELPILMSGARHRCPRVPAKESRPGSRGR